MGDGGVGCMLRAETGVSSGVKLPEEETEFRVVIELY